MSFLEIRMHKTSLGKRIPYKITLWLLFRVQILCLFIRVFTYCLHVLWGKIASYLKNTPQTHLKHTSFVFGVPKNTARSSLKRWEICVSSVSSIELLWVAIIKIRHNDFKRKKNRWELVSLGEKIFYRLLAWVPTFRRSPIPKTSTPTKPISSVSMWNAGVWVVYLIRAWKVETTYEITFLRDEKSYHKDYWWIW